MEYNNQQIYEAIKPTRTLGKNKSSRKKMWLALAIVAFLLCGVGVIANADRLNINLPLGINNLTINSNTAQVYPWINHSIPITLLNPDLINPSFSMVGFKIGYN